MKVTSDCRLTGASPELVAVITKKLTLDNPQYVKAKKYGRFVGKRVKPHLHFYTKVGDLLTFPRGFAGEAARLCRLHMPQAHLTIVDERQSVPPVGLAFTGLLRSDQQEALDHLRRKDFGVLEAATGAGKTVIALALIALRDQPTLILVHTKELLHQWVERISAFLGVAAGRIGDDHFEIAPVTVGIVNSARKHLDTLPSRFGHLCVDECHRVPASLFTDVVTAFDCRYMLGLSATAFRSDGLTELIHFYLGGRQFTIDQQRLERSGAILRPEFIQQPTTFHFSYRDNFQDLMKALTTDHERNQLIVRDIVAHSRHKNGGGGAILVVSDRVEHCELLARLVAQDGIAVQLLTGKMATDDRAAAVMAIQNGAARVVIATVQLIGEGFDCPGLETLFLTTPIKFTGRLMQVVGRILRPAEGKKATVYDYVDPVGVLETSARSRQRLYRSP